MDFVSLGKVLFYSSLLENFPSSFCLSEGSQSRDSQIFIFTKTSAPYFYQNVGNSAFVKNSQLLNLARMALVLYPQKKVSASSFLKNTYNSQEIRQEKSLFIIFIFARVFLVLCIFLHRRTAWLGTTLFRKYEKNIQFDSQGECIHCW